MAYLDKVKLADYTRKEDWLNSISRHGRRRTVGSGTFDVLHKINNSSQMGLSAFELYIRHRHDSYVFVLFGLPRIAP